MQIKPGEITDILKSEIKDYDREIDVAETGTVLNAGDGIARVYGLENALAGELVEFEGGVHVRLLGDVDLAKDPMLPELGGGGLAPFFVEICDHDARPGATEAKGGGATEAARGTGDEGDCGRHLHGGPP